MLDGKCWRFASVSRANYSRWPAVGEGWQRRTPPPTDWQPGLPRNKRRCLALKRFGVFVETGDINEPTSTSSTDSMNKQTSTSSTYSVNKPNLRSSTYKPSQPLYVRVHTIRPIQIGANPGRLRRRTRRSHQEQLAKRLETTKILHKEINWFTKRLPNKRHGLLCISTLHRDNIVK